MRAIEVRQYTICMYESHKVGYILTARQLGIWQKSADMYRKPDFRNGGGQHLSELGVQSTLRIVEVSGRAN